MEGYRWRGQGRRGVTQRVSRQADHAILLPIRIGRVDDSGRNNVEIALAASWCGSAGFGLNEVVLISSSSGIGRALWQKVYLVGRYNWGRGPSHNFCVTESY